MAFSISLITYSRGWIAWLWIDLETYFFLHDIFRIPQVHSNVDRGWAAAFDRSEDLKLSMYSVKNMAFSQSLMSFTQG